MKLTKMKTHIQARQTIPAKDVLASLAHHLSTAFVFFNGNGAHRTTFYQVVVVHQHWVMRSTRLTRILFASDWGMPLKTKSIFAIKRQRRCRHWRSTNWFLAAWAEIHAARWAQHRARQQQHSIRWRRLSRCLWRRCLINWPNWTDRLTVSIWTPKPVLVQLYLWK